MNHQHLRRRPRYTREQVRRRRMAVGIVLKALALIASCEIAYDVARALPANMVALSLAIMLGVPGITALLIVFSFE